MTTEYTRATSDVQREALAHYIARLRTEGVPWDGPGGIVTTRRLVSGAPQGRALLRKYGLTAEQGGLVEIRPSYDRHAINPQTGKRKGHRESRRTRVSRSPGPVGARAGRASESAHTHRAGAHDARYRPIRRLVRRIRRERDAAVPDVCASAAGIEADVLVVLSDPGRVGALNTTYLCVHNPDATAGNQRRLFAATRLPLEACLFWNAVPWDLDGRNPSRSDLVAGARYLSDLVGLMARPPIVVACGNAAHDGCALADLDAIEICHPSDRGLRGGGVDREAEHVAGLRQAARQLRARRTT